MIFRNVQYFDIFDEVDAQMHPKKSFVYSIGASSQLDEPEFRADVCIALLDTLCLCLPELCENSLVVFDETEKEARQALSEGRFPKGYRYITSIADQPETKRKINHILLSKMIDNSEGSANFIKKFTQK